MKCRSVLSFFLANNTGVPQEEVLGLIKPISHNSCNWTLRSYNSAGVILCGVIEIGNVLECNLITKSTSQCKGNPGSSSGKTSAYSQTTRGRHNSCLVLSSRVRLTSQPCNCLWHLDRTRSGVKHHAYPPKI